MLQTFKLKTSFAVSLVCAALAGCGGGSAEPPPPPLGAAPPSSVPDTTPPTVTIANNVSAPTASGPVTFTFVFSEDVGVSFDATDIAVTGGTPSGFARLPGGTQATLVVTPTPNTSGTITVSVAAGKFTDLAGNSNTTAATASKDFAAPPPPPPVNDTLLANFDTVSPPIAGFEGGEGSAVEPGPAGGSGNALKVLRSGGQVFALAIVTLPSTIPLEANRKTISARVYSPTAGIPMVLKLEGPGGNPSSGDIQANETVVVGWQTLTWTVNAVNTNYNVLVLLPNLGTVDAPPGKAYYFDDITLLAASTGGGGSGPVIFSSGLGAGNRTVEAGAFGGYGGSSLDNFGCNGDPAWCGSGGSFVPGVTAANSSFFFYYQTPSPVTALFAGVFIQAPGLTTGLSPTGDTPGVSIAGKTTMKFRFNQNPEWFNGPANNFGVILTLGKFYDLDPGAGVQPCNIKLLAVVTPTAVAPTDYAIPISSFAIIQACNVAGLTPASALALSPLSQVDFQGVGSSNPLPPVGGKLVGSNMTVGVGSPQVFPTTLAVTGGITFEP